MTSMAGANVISAYKSLFIRSPTRFGSGLMEPQHNSKEICILDGSL